LAGVVKGAQAAPGTLLMKFEPEESA